MFSDIFLHVESGFNHFRSVLHDPSARLAALSAVEKEIDASKQRLLSLHNAFAPTSLLPPEFLARVFHFLSLYEPLFSGKRDLDWMRATHVCQIWRQVALGDLLLWTRISGVPTNSEFVSEILARAKGAPLDIDLIKLDDHFVDKRLTRKVLFTFPPHLSHTRSLCLHKLSKYHFDGLLGICSRDAPALERFELSVSFISSPINFRDLGWTTLFEGQAPRLRTLILSEVLIPWPPFPCGQLTWLQIYLGAEASIADVTSLGDLNQLVDLLVNSPQLEALILVSCLPSQLSQFPHDQTVHLPCLSRLILTGTCSHITNLLKILKIPSTTKLQLSCTPENASTFKKFFFFF